METMKHQINLLSQLQELILTRDEHHQTGDGSHLDSLNDSIDALVEKLEPQPKASRGEPRKTGVSRFSAEELMVCDLKGETTEAVIRELAEAMAENNFVSNADALVSAAMDREIVLSTAMGDGLAFPHVRGVEGGGLTLALGVSRKGFIYDDEGTRVNFVFFSAIPVAVSAFYLRLIGALSEAFSKKENRDLLLAAKTPAELWKALMKATRYSVR